MQLLITMINVINLEKTKYKNSSSGWYGHNSISMPNVNFTV